MVEEIGYRQIAEQGRDAPADQQEVADVAVTRPASVPRAENGHHQQRRDVEEEEGEAGQLRRGTPATFLEDRDEAGLNIGVERGAPRDRIAADRQGRRQQGNHDHRRPGQCQADQRHIAAPQQPQEGEPEEPPFDKRHLLDGYRHAAQQHREQRSLDDAPHLACLRGINQQPRGHGHQQIIEHRRLAVHPADQRDHQQIRQRTQRRTDRAGKAQRHLPDDERGRRGEGRRDEVEHQDAAAQRCDPGVDQEQAKRLAVPHIDIGPMPGEQLLAGQQVELVIGVCDGVPPRHDPRRDRNGDDQQDGNAGRGERGGRNAARVPRYGHRVRRRRFPRGRSVPCR